MHNSATLAPRGSHTNTRSPISNSHALVAFLDDIYISSRNATKVQIWLCVLGSFIASHSLSLGFSSSFLNFINVIPHNLGRGLKVPQNTKF